MLMIVVCEERLSDSGELRMPRHIWLSFLGDLSAERRTRKGCPTWAHSAGYNEPPTYQCSVHSTTATWLLVYLQGKRTPVSCLLIMVDVPGCRRCAPSAALSPHRLAV